MSHSKLKFLLLTFIVLSIVGCGFYKFTGADIPAQANTISISYFENKADLIEPSLSQILTDALKDRFSSQTTLSIASSDGDLQVIGYISEYSTTPQAIQGDKAALNRLTITVNVDFINIYDPSKGFESSSFSRYEDYPSTDDLNSVQDALIAVIIEAIVDDIFNATVVNW